MATKRATNTMPEVTRKPEPPPAPPAAHTTVAHVLAMLDVATINRDEAKLIGIRAIRRAKYIEDRARIFGGPSE